MIDLKEHIDHSVYWGYKHSLQNATPFFFAKPPPLNLQTAQAPLLGNSLWVFTDLPPPH